jgi:hypothetical protein
MGVCKSFYNIFGEWAENGWGRLRVAEILNPSTHQPINPSTDI